MNGLRRILEGVAIVVLAAALIGLWIDGKAMSREMGVLTTEVRHLNKQIDWIVSRWAVENYPQESR